jgi:N-acetylneuraminic acid mutarotase
LDAWEERTAMPTARAFAGAATSGDRVFVIGGENASGVLGVNEIYLPVLDGSGESPWLIGSALPEGRAGIGVASFSDFIYVIGGRGADERSLPSLQYISQQESWQAFDAPFNAAWSDFGLAAAGSQVFVLGGRAGGQTLANLMVYQAVYTVSIPFLSGEQ